MEEEPLKFASENVKIHYEMKSFQKTYTNVSLDDLTETCASALNSDSQIRAVDLSCWRTVCADVPMYGCPWAVPV